MSNACINNVIERTYIQMSNGCTCSLTVLLRAGGCGSKGARAGSSATAVESPPSCCIAMDDNRAPVEAAATWDLK